MLHQSDLIAKFRQSQICIVLPEHQPVFGAARHDPIWFVSAFGHQIIKEHTYIRLTSVKDEWLLTVEFQSSVDACHESLCRCFFISGTAVELSAAEEILYGSVFEIHLQIQRIDTIVFDCICRSYDF